MKNSLISIIILIGLCSTANAFTHAVDIINDTETSWYGVEAALFNSGLDAFCLYQVYLNLGVNGSILNETYFNVSGPTNYYKYLDYALTENSSDCFTSYWSEVSYNCNEMNFSSNDNVSICDTTTTTITTTTTTTTATPTTLLPPSTSFYSTSTTQDNNQGTLPGLTGPTLPKGQGGLGNMSKMGDKILGLSIQKFNFLFVYLIIGIIILTISYFNKRFGLLMGAVMLDFAQFVGGWITLTISVLMLLNAIAVIYWFTEDE